jgi:hypothetical protein
MDEINIGDEYTWKSGAVAEILDMGRGITYRLKGVDGVYWAHSIKSFRFADKTRTLEKEEHMHDQLELFNVDLASGVIINLREDA